MLRIFASGLSANVFFVVSGLLKQYLVASTLSVADFGVYGSLVALASLLLVGLPFPAYLNIMIHGFSASATAFGTRKRLILGARTELIALVLVAIGLCALLAVYAWAVDSPDPRLWLLALLLAMQYATACVDLLLRMQRAHTRLALFMTVRNLPTVALLASLHPATPLHVVGLEFIATAGVAAYFMLSKELRIPYVFKFRRIRASEFRLEQVTLWLARLAQFGNSSLLRLLVPWAYVAHETGLFFFALIAQLPCSLFLSVTTQLFGHSLAQVRPGQWRLLLTTQAWFALPNLAYVLVAAMLLPNWGWFISLAPKLSKYQDAGPLVMAVIVYSMVLTSDCQEYLLRARGLSRVLLSYYGSSVLLQLAVVGIASWQSMSLVHTLYACAAMQATTLIAFSAYSFHRVLGRFKLELDS